MPNQLPDPRDLRRQSKEGWLERMRQAAQERREDREDYAIYLGRQAAARKENQRIFRNEVEETVSRAGRAAEQAAQERRRRTSVNVDDRAIGEAVAKELRKHGYKAWYSVTNHTYGDYDEADCRVVLEW